MRLLISCVYISVLLFVLSIGNAVAQDDIYATPTNANESAKVGIMQRFKLKPGDSRLLFTTRIGWERCQFSSEQGLALSWKPQHSMPMYIGAELALFDIGKLQIEFGKQVLSSYYNDRFETFPGQRDTTFSVNLRGEYFVVPLTLHINLLKTREERLMIDFIPHFNVGILQQGTLIRTFSYFSPGLQAHNIATEDFTKLLISGGFGINFRVKVLPYCWLQTEARYSFSLNNLNNGVLRVSSGVGSASRPAQVNASVGNISGGLVFLLW